MTEKNKAVLVAVHLPDATDAEHLASLAELERLVSTLGYQTVARISQKRDALSSATVVGEGKLKELAAITGGTGHVGTTAPQKKDKARLKREGAEVDDEDGDSDPEDGDSDADSEIALVAVDHDLTPSQARNLERAVGTSVLDRTGVIVEIFHRHAKSREARLQVEIARLKYTAPRMRESPSGREKQQGRGAGEAALELDRRKIRDRIKELEEELEVIAKDQDERRQHRKDARRVALVGYTNAGKSSLMRALTGSQVLVEDKLFATLDTTVRALHPEVKPRILVSDTVGFIKKLPHDLVASFKSTLDEAKEATLLLHVVDASDPTFESQYAVTREVLAEIGASDVPARLVLNKCDCITAEAREALERRYPDAFFCSARLPEDVARLRAHIIGFFEDRYVDAEVLVPYDRQAVVARMHDEAKVVSQDYREDGVLVVLRGDADTVARLRRGLE